MTGDPLLTETGRARVEEAVRLIEALAETDPVRLVARARQLADADVAAAALSQVELRRRGTAKFGAAAGALWFTPDGLEQASRPEVADHRAARFAAVGAASVLDLCCGIGGDVLAFQRAGLAVAAVERDPVTAAVAAANTGVPITVGDAEDAPWETADSVFLDPARRTTRGRTFDPSAFSPSFDFVRQVLSRSRLAAAKLAPGLDHALIPDGHEAEWVSLDGEVKEAVLYSAGFTTAGVSRRASVLRTDVPGAATLTDADGSTDDVADIGAYLFEPDGAVIRAGLVRHAAAAIDGWRIDEQLAYLSADQPHTSPLLKSYRVHDVLPFSLRTLKAELRRRQVGTVEIKKRGVDVDPAQLRRELKPSGPHSLTVVLARLGPGSASRRVAVLAEPLR